MLADVETRYHEDVKQWELCEDIAVRSRGVVLVVRKGFLSDGASTPRATWSLGFAPFELGYLPAFVHDWLYEHGGHITVRTDAGDVDRTFTKHDADLFFLDLMGQVGIDAERRLAAYEAVTLAGQSSWQPSVASSPSSNA